MRRLAAVLALMGVGVLGLGAAFVFAGPKVGSPTTVTVSDSATTSDSAPTGDFTYDGQTIPYSSWASDMGDASGGKLVYVTTPFSFDCAPGSLTASAKKAFDPLKPQVFTVYTFTVGAGSDPAVPAGSVIVGVGIHSGNGFNVDTSEWVSDGSQVKITLDKGYSNAKVFYCTPMSESVGTTTITVPTTGTGTLPVTVTDPGTTTTLPGSTISTDVDVTVSVPQETTTAAGTSTSVTVPPGTTVTVTLPERTVTLPAVTVTVDGQTVERDAATVTLPGTTATVTAAATTTVVTVTGPNKVVREGLLAAKHAHVTLTTPRRVVRVGAHTIRGVAKGRFAGKKVIVVIVRASGCPAGTALYNGECRAVVRGQG